LGPTTGQTAPADRTDAAAPVEGRPATGESHGGRRRRNWRRPAGSFAAYVVTVFVLITLNFWIPRAMPGDPIDGLLAQGSSGFVFGEDARTKLEEYYSLDGSLGAQYVHYLARLAHGDLGRSIVTNRPVTHEVGVRLPWTALLVTGAIVISTAAGLVAGVRSGWRREGRMDKAFMTGLLAIREVPPFLLASLLLLVFAVKLELLPLFGGETPFSSSFSLAERVVDIGRHALLPMLVLAVGLTAGTYLIMRAGMVSQLGSDYLVLGRAKGLRERRLKYRYAARNALLPVVSNAALQVGYAISANVLVERVFSYPGLGRLLFESVAVRDYPTIQGVFLVVSITVVTINALADALYRRLDPRTTA
jgi:peptide/nickel transport system permease protein